MWRAVARSPEHRAHIARHEIGLIRPGAEGTGLLVQQTTHSCLEARCACGHWTRTQTGRADAEAETPERNRLDIRLRQDGRPAPVADVNGWTSPRLGIRFALKPHTLEVFDPAVGPGSPQYFGPPLPYFSPASAPCLRTVLQS